MRALQESFFGALWTKYDARLLDCAPTLASLRAAKEKPDETACASWKGGTLPLRAFAQRVKIEQVEVAGESSYPELRKLLLEDAVNRAGRTGGTFLHSSRTRPSHVPKSQVPDHLKEKYQDDVNDLTPEVLQNLAFLGVDSLIPIGGDDTLSYGVRLHQEGIKVIAIPKTMDNDVRNTEYCIGFSTAITRAMDAIERQRTTVGSHERIGIFRVFGRDAGFTALYTAHVTSIRCVIPEYKVDLAHLVELLMEEKRANPSNYALVVLSEGAEWKGYQVMEYGEPDAYGHRKKASVGEALADEIKRRTGEETIASDLTYDLRSGDPDFIDKLIASTFGTMALDALLEGKSGLMSSLVNGQYDMVPISNRKLGPR